MITRYLRRVRIELRIFWDKKHSINLNSCCSTKSPVHLSDHDNHCRSATFYNFHDNTLSWVPYRGEFVNFACFLSNLNPNLKKINKLQMNKLYTKQNERKIFNLSQFISSFHGLLMLIIWLNQSLIFVIYFFYKHTHIYFIIKSDTYFIIVFHIYIIYILYTI